MSSNYRRQVAGSTIPLLINLLKRVQTLYENVNPVLRRRMNRILTFIDNTNHNLTRMVQMEIADVLSSDGGKYDSDNDNENNTLQEGTWANDLGESDTDSNDDHTSWYETSDGKNSRIMNGIDNEDRFGMRKFRRGIWEEMWKSERRRRGRAQYHHGDDDYFDRYGYVYDYDYDYDYNDTVRSHRQRRRFRFHHEGEDEKITPESEIKKDSVVHDLLERRCGKYLDNSSETCGMVVTINPTYKLKMK